MDTKELIAQLYEIDGIKFGEFKLKSGIMSPIYIDLRVIISYPKVLRMVAEALWEKAKNLSFDLICGVPYTALPIATVMSIEHNKPMVMRRKEVKEYGTRKAIEGAFISGQTVLVVEDLVTSGSSVFETIEPLELEGLKVKNIVVLLDRQQGGKENLAGKNYNLHAVFNMAELLDNLLDGGKIDQKTHQKVTKFIDENQIKK
ncbi:orotate phosphoribosyltransferase [Patescibacteria group bacterium]|nr:orotate phosphoribosyltransferase [Patescibacteria group bacterium]